MKVDERLLTAARRTVAENTVDNVPVNVIGYERVFVSIEGVGGLKEFAFFTEGEKKYAVGVKNR